MRRPDEYFKFLRCDKKSRFSLRKVSACGDLAQKQEGGAVSGAALFKTHGITSRRKRRYV
jgi:hypothetical protein